MVHKANARTVPGAGEGLGGHVLYADSASLDAVPVRSPRLQLYYYGTLHTQRHALAVVWVLCGLLLLAIGLSDNGHGYLRLSALATRFQPKDLVKWPTGAISVEHGPLGNPELFSKNIQVLRLAIKNNYDSPNPITRLLAGCNPAAVTGFIVPIVINPIKLQSSFVATPHVREEICKDIPALTDFDPPPAVTVPMPIIRIGAATNHGRPYSYQRVTMFARQTEQISLTESASDGIVRHVRNDNGQWNDSPLHSWFDGLRSKNGLCCSFADGLALKDVDWDIDDDGHYRVRIAAHSVGGLPDQDEWVRVPDEAVITSPNRAGSAIVWPYLDNGAIMIRCFMPGAGT